jgi:glycosyltransferase involved in cell wall biosynthesis
MTSAKSKRRQKVKILQITRDSFPSAIRAVKEGLSFHNNGYKSAVLCTPKKDQPDYEVWEGIELFRPKILRDRSFFDKLLSETAFFSFCWYRAINQVIKKYNPEIIHVHDIWLGRVVFAVQTKQKIVIDLHENMPAAVVEYQKGCRGPQLWFRLLFHGKSRIFSYERNLLEKSDLILTVVQEAHNRVLTNHPHLNSDKVVNVENLESKRFIADPSKGEAAFEKDHFSILYIGGFGPHRGIDTLIQAMAVIKEQKRNIKIQLIGAQPSQYLDKLEKLISDLGVKEQVQITGWVDSEDVLANIKKADVCCVPHHSNPHTDNTIPHKLFQYMIAKRPILVSSSPPLARTIKQANAGMVFLAGDPSDCAAKIIEFSNDSNLLGKFADNGYNYVANEGHNWEEESESFLIKSYDKLCDL